MIDAIRSHQEAVGLEFLPFDHDVLEEIGENDDGAFGG